MHRYFVIFSLLPLFLVADNVVGNKVRCMTLSNGHALCWVVSDEIDPPMDGEGLGEIVMTRQNCEDLRSMMLAYVSQVQAQAAIATNQLYNAWNEAEYIDDQLIQALSDISSAESLSSGYQDIALDTAIVNARNEVQQAKYSVTAILGELQMSSDSVDEIITTSEGIRSSISAVECRDATCSGSSSNLSCPCTDEFNEIIDRMDGKKPNTLLTMSTNLVAMALRLNMIYTSVTNMQDNLSKIVSRLNSPDDRMWQELVSLYGEFTNAPLSTSYFTLQIMNRTVNLDSLLYNIRHAISGHDGGQPIQLSTEGVLQLFSGLGSMFTWVTQTEFLNHFDEQFGAFSNTVYQLFNNFNQAASFRTGSAGNNLLNSMRERSQYLYTAATNIKYSVRDRYSYLISNGQGRMTNWFSRIEFYLQDLLGWYEDRNPESQLTENQPHYSTSIDNMVDEGTNNVGMVSASLGTATNVLSGLLSPVSESLKNAQFSASLPSRVVMFPDVTIMDYDMEFYIDTQEIAEYCDKARDVTSLIWIVGFWAVAVASVALIARVLVKGILWLIKYISDGA